MLNIVKILCVIIIIIIVVYLLLKLYFNNFENYKIQNQNHDIIMFIHPSSKDCIKMLKIIGNENSISEILVVDISSKEGADIIDKNKINVSTLPYFINTKNGKVSQGLKNGINDIKKSLL